MIRPLSTLLFAFLFISSYTQSIQRSAIIQKDAALEYTLDIKSDTMHVSVEYFPLLPDSTVFKYGNFFYGGMKDLLLGLKNINSSAKFRIDSVGSSLIFFYPDYRKITISYDIIDTHMPVQRVVGEMFRPIITHDYFFSLSHTLFLNPVIRETMKDSIMMSVRLKPDPLFPLYMTFAPEVKPGEAVSVKLSDGLDALVTGASDLHIEKRELSGVMNYIVLRINRNDDYNLIKFMDYIDTFLPAMNDFWGSMNGTFYSLVASPFLDIKYHKISGTSFRGGFHVKYSGDTILADDEVVFTISHEIMHRFVGSGCLSMGENNQWFDEGFTDYTTWYLLSECGILPPGEIEEQVRNTYKNLMASPVKNTPNEDVMKHFWDNHDYEKLPYWRGALFAAYMDKRISDISNGTRSYREFMRCLKTYAENKKSALTIEDFISVASEFMDRNEIRSCVERFIMKGEMIPEFMIFE